MPNIPQMDAVWSDLGGAWVKATKGPARPRRAVAFRTAARTIANKIGGKTALNDTARAPGLRAPAPLGCPGAEL